MTRVVLGSASSGRLSVLRKAGVEPVVVVSGVDEDAVLAGLGPCPSPGDAVRLLAAAKAKAVARALGTDLRTDCVVIGCDSMLYRDGRLSGKPASEAAAIDSWQEMAGTSGELYTGHCVIRLRHGHIQAEAVEHAVTTIHFGSPAADDLTAYVRSGEPTAVAGGFTLDGLGGWFVERIEGDPSNVIGLSLPLTRRMLAEVGLSISALWQANSLA